MFAKNKRDIGKSGSSVGHRQNLFDKNILLGLIAVDAQSDIFIKAIRILLVTIKVSLSLL